MATVQTPRQSSPLLQTQRNEVLKLVQAAGFSPAAFEWQVRPSTYLTKSDVDCLVHRGTGFNCIFDNVVVLSGQPGFGVRYSPGREHPAAGVNTKSWMGAMSTVQGWLRYLRREITSPDLWTDALSGGETLNLADTDESNTPFSADEVRAIEARIVVVNEFFAGLGLPAPAYEAITQKLDYLIEASKRTGRIDWKNITMSTVMGISFTAALNTEQARQIFTYLVGIAQRLLAG